MAAGRSGPASSEVCKASERLRLRTTAASLPVPLAERAELRALLLRLAASHKRHHLQCLCNPDLSGSNLPLQSTPSLSPCESGRYRWRNCGPAPPCCAQQNHSCHKPVDASPVTNAFPDCRASGIPSEDCSTVSSHRAGCIPAAVPTGLVRPAPVKVARPLLRRALRRAADHEPLVRAILRRDALSG